LEFHHRASHARGELRLEARGLRTPAFPGQALDFKVRPGEIVGLAGLVGSGRTELLRVLFGIDRAVAGEVRVDGQPVELHSPRAAIRAGLALVPEDRKQQGVILEMAVEGNVTLPSLARQAKSGFRRRHAETRLAQRMSRQLRVKAPSLGQLVQFLSGGNQQKIVLAKWLALQPKVLLLDEPTRGIDVGAKQDIYLLLDELATEGMVIFFASSEMEEVLRLSDRALVMHQGSIRGQLARQDLSEEAIMQLATGGGVTAGPRSS
jgi:ribose transport system ATP-binding protein